ncbi:hypothetical protein B9Z55_017051 [Caenorhabditis nigoni]|uniref:Uncharacterized protein n=1 Tax=Caenorhabditis nigoni TaxID=1611254 RepID=A0A2G5T899_9PELO|nr:hypothetical protein B9Z55_017051 [Caenorhabditis nigoni]
MRRSIAIISVLLVSQTSGFLFGGGCCQAPVMQSPCCGGATSWAYAPPQVIGYERIPLYAKVPMPAPPTYYYPPPPPPAYQPQPSYPAPMDNFASGPSSSSSSSFQPTITSVSNRIPSAIPPPQDKYDDGDVIVQPPPQGYVSSQPVAPQGYQQGPPPQQPQGYMGQVEQGIEVTPDQINSGYQPHQGEAQAQFSSSQGQFAQSQGQFAQGQQFDGASDIASQSTGLVQSVANNAAFESAGIAPSARRLRKFKN